jgi:hypothetical protein
MNKVQFQLDYLDNLVKTLQHHAETQENLYREVQDRLRAAQSVGANESVTGQLRSAASLLAEHPSLVRGLSRDLKSRLDIAHSVADEWQGPLPELRIGLTMAMTATTGLLAAVGTAVGLNQKGETADAAAAKKAVDAEAARVAAEMWLVERARDLWHVLDAPGSRLINGTKVDAAVAAVNTGLDISKGMGSHGDPMGVVSKAVIENAGGLVIGHIVDGGMLSAGAAAGVAATGPVVVAGLVIGDIATDGFNNVVEEYSKVDWAREVTARGPYAFNDMQPVILARATLDTGVDVWNKAAYSLALTGEAGQFVGQQLRAGTVGVGPWPVGSLGAGETTR